MNEPRADLPPVDPVLRAQLMRRSRGRLPEDLLDSVELALDADVEASSRSGVRAFLPNPGLLGRRLAGVAAGLLVAAVVGALALGPSLLRSQGVSPQGYLSQRALTTDELVRLLFGEQPVPLNEALIANVTIERRNYSCSGGVMVETFDPAIESCCGMNRYPTYGVIEAGDNRICVMAGNVGQVTTPTSVSGIFAFRYLATDTLGLLGQISPASNSQLAYSDPHLFDRSSQGFLFHGWLYGFPVSPSDPGCLAQGSFSPGDPLYPGTDDCFTDVLGASVADLATPSRQVTAADTVGISYVSASAGGARYFDSISRSQPVEGYYVLRWATLGCPGQSVVSDVGCTQLQVMAKLDENLLIPEPTPTPGPATPEPVSAAPTQPPDTTYPARPLEADELAAAMAAGQTTDGAVVASGTIATATAGCSSEGGYLPIGRLQTSTGGLCVVGIDDQDAKHRPKSASGTFAFRVLDSHTLGYMATVDGTPRPGEAWPVGSTLLVWGWLTSSVEFCPNLGSLVPEPLDPVGDGCPQVFLSDSPVSATLPTEGPAAGWHQLLLPGYPSNEAVSLGSPHFFLIRDEATCALPTTGISDRVCGWQIMAQINPLPELAVPSPTVALSPGIGADSLGLAGPGGRPLTVAEFPTLWAADPNHLANRIVLVKGPVPTGFECWDAGAADASASPGTCHIAVLSGYVAQEGYWAIRVGADGKMSLVGEVKMPSGGMTFSVAELDGGQGLAAGELGVVDGWLAFSGLRCDIIMPTNNPPCSPSWLQDSGDQHEILVQSDAFATFADPTTDMSTTHAFYLVKMTGPGQAMILARLETSTPLDTGP